MASKAKSKSPAAVAEAESCCCAEGTFCWGTAARFWWAVTWRTFMWISLPIMLVQFGLAWLQTPELAMGLMGMGMMFLTQIPTLVGHMVVSPEFWFFIAVTAYTIIGSMFVYGYLASKGTFGGVSITLTRTKK